MRIEDVKKVTVVGSGTMGTQISMVCALAGYQVAVADSNEASLVKAKETLNGHLKKWVAKGKLTEDALQASFARMNFTTSLEKALEETDFVIEAVPEILELKREVFAQLDKLAPKHAILATNSSYIPSSRIADATARPDKVCNVHFFHPVLVMQFVEVVKGPHTSEETAQVAYELCKKINKIPVLLKKEVEGFLANRILRRIIEEALWLVDEGVATFEDIDLACTKALNHPMGPFTLMDFSGLDIGYYNAMNKYKETGNEADKPHRLIAERVEKGHLGRKTGKGFYDYTETAAAKE